MKRIITGLLIFSVMVAGYYLWSRSGRVCDSVPLETDILYSKTYGIDAGNGNLVGIQPYMVPTDYANKQRFLAKMDAYLGAAREQGWFNAKTVVVLPEYLGTWLVLAEEKSSLYESTTVENSMTWLAVSNLDTFIPATVSAPAADRIKYALFRMKSPLMAQIYDDVFSSLASKYQVTIVAGSIILASPSVQHGHLVSGTGPLYSISPLYLPNGMAADQLVHKAFPTQYEQTFLKAAPVEDLPVFESSLGKIGVMICADSWFPEAYRVLQQKGAAVAAVPSYINGSMEIPWDGCSGWPNPADVAEADINNISLGEAWSKYAFAGRMPVSGIPVGIRVCLRGDLWDLGSDGSSIVVKDGQVTVLPIVKGAALVNLWL